MPGRKRKKRLTQKATGITESIVSTKYPRHAIDKALRIPRALLDQNAGRECGERDAARFGGDICRGRLTINHAYAKDN
jgi:hypothetical protein